MKELSYSFRAMNTEVMVVVGFAAGHQSEAEGALGRVETLFAGNEATMSRFLAESELSKLNRSSGEEFVASPRLFDVVEAALAAARATGGVFDPTVLGDLIAAGYDRSFEFLSSHEPGPPEEESDVAGRAAHRSCSWQDVRIDRRASTIALPRGCGLDLGGIGKGWTVDQASKILHPFANYAIDAGGDIYAAGTQIDGEAWTVGVADPFDPSRDLAILAAVDRAIATSTVGKRRWTRADGVEMHHLIDPRTGLPGRGDVVSTTVIADSVVRAEILAKTALLLGGRDGARFLAGQQGIEWIMVLSGGETQRSAGLPEVQYAS